MAYMKTLLLVVAVIFGITVCCSGVDNLHLQDEQQQDSSSSLHKRSLKSGVGLLLPYGMG